MGTSAFDIIEKDPQFRHIIRNMVEASIMESFNAIMITDAQPGYGILLVNPAFCEMTGYTPDEILGKSPALLQGEKTDPAVLDRLRKDLEAGRTFHGQAINYRKDGSEFVMEWKIAPIRNQENEISHDMAIQREVS